jgi:hypothetical protein
MKSVNMGCDTKVTSSNKQVILSKLFRIQPRIKVKPVYNEMPKENISHLKGKAVPLQAWTGP